MSELAAMLKNTCSLSDPDVVLMLRVQRDEPGAFEELIAQYWPRLFGRFFRQFGDRQECEDFVQDVFLRLFRNRKRYRPSAKLCNWLFHIARNVARNACRSRQRRPVTPVAFINGVEESSVFRQLMDDVEMPSRPLERAEVASLVRNAVASLRGRQRAAIEMQCRDHSYSEIAAKLDMTAKAAKSLLYRARNELRQTLSPFVESLS